MMAAMSVVARPGWVLVLPLVLLAGCTDREEHASAGSISRQSADELGCSVGKVAPPSAALHYRVVGHAGNEWVLPAARFPVQVQVQVIQAEGASVTGMRFEITTGTGSHMGSVVRRLPVQEQWSPGVHDLRMSWDGRDDRGKAATRGSYRLFGTASVLREDSACDSGAGAATEASGLGILVVK